MAAGDIYRVSLTGNVFGQTVMHVLHFRMKSGAGTVSGLQTVVASQFANDMSAQQSEDLMWTSCAVRGLIPLADVSEFTFPGGYAGQLVGESEPSFVAAIASLKTGTPGRSTRGRMYIPGVRTSDVTDNNLAGGWQTSMQTVLSNLVGAYGAAGTNPDYQWGIWSRKIGLDVPPHNAAGFTVVSSATLRSDLASFNTRKATRGI